MFWNVTSHNIASQLSSVSLVFHGIPSRNHEARIISEHYDYYCTRQLPLSEAHIHPNTTFRSSFKPIVSTANLGQLAVDLLVSSLGLERVGIFDSDFVFPAVGGREDGSTGVTTPLELFGKKGFPFYFLQQRSPVIKV